MGACINCPGSTSWINHSKYLIPTFHNQPAPQRATALQQPTTELTAALKKKKKCTQTSNNWPAPQKAVACWRLVVTFLAWRRWGGGLCTLCWCGGLGLHIHDPEWVDGKQRSGGVAWAHGKAAQGLSVSWGWGDSWQPRMSLLWNEKLQNTELQCTDCWHENNIFSYLVTWGQCKTTSLATWEQFGTTSSTTW